MARYDIAVIGTGPAGISAAITAKVRNKSVLLLGSRDLSGKLAKAHEIRNYPGFPAVSGADLAKALSAHLSQMGIEISDRRVSAIYAMGEYFTLQCGPDFEEADAVILATGVTAAKALPGEEALLGRGVSYCATCDASLYRGKRCAVLSWSAAEEGEAEFLSEVASEVLYFPVYKEEPRLADGIRVIREKPLAIEEENGQRVVVTGEGRYPADGVFVLRESIAPGQLVPGLETEGAHIRVDRSMATSLPGCFACGDIAGTPYQYIKAAGEGNVAALSAVAYLDKRRRKDDNT
ncbi:MAG: NAD(P)/FAD-dependent oxidoreductase [Clostridia bacterium]|nr:NAD(P)/FAD-dependent oxidoreductase [Clostridia bacterium]